MGLTNKSMQTKARVEIIIGPKKPKGDQFNYLYTPKLTKIDMNDH